MRPNIAWSPISMHTGHKDQRQGRLTHMYMQTTLYVPHRVIIHQHLYISKGQWSPGRARLITVPYPHPQLRIDGVEPLVL